jgi:hypothetical protein
MPKHITRRAPARNRTNDLPDLFAWPSTVNGNPLSRAVAESNRYYPNIRLNDCWRVSHCRDDAQWISRRCQERAAALDPAAVAVPEALPERLHVRDAASVTTSAGMEAYHVG